MIIYSSWLGESLWEAESLSLTCMGGSIQAGDPVGHNLI